MRIRLLFVLAALAAAACTPQSATFGGAPAAPATAIERIAPQASGYKIVAFHYHLMRLRDAAARPTGNAKVIYPDDLTDYGGPLMTSEAAFNIYVNCASKNQACWGLPEAFQKNLTGSSFAGLLRQYTQTGPGSFTFGGSTAVKFPVYRGTAVYENDLLTILHGVAATRKKTGYSNLYHIFLPKGTDTCFDFTPYCYSPDYNPTFDFCAYHGTVRYSDIGLVVYSVEPYQDVKGCLTVASAGAGELTNSTASTLAHETFESITDPGPKLAWFNKIDGEEMADECEYYVARVPLNGTAYNLQPMYSNKYHACATGP